MSRQWTLGVILATALLIPAVAPAHEGHAHKVMGTVSSIEGTNLMVKMADGKTVMVMLDGKTKVSKGKTKIDVAALKVGDRVVAQGPEEKDMIMATTVKVAEAPAAAKK